MPTVPIELHAHNGDMPTVPIELHGHNGDMPTVPTELHAHSPYRTFHNGDMPTVPIELVTAKASAPVTRRPAVRNSFDDGVDFTHDKIVSCAPWVIRLKRAGVMEFCTGTTSRQI